MLAINIRIGHEHNLVIPGLLRVEVFAHACTECSDHRLNFVVSECLIQTCLLNVEDLASQRKDGLGVRVTALNCRTTRGVTLHHEDFRERRILACAVLQLSGHAATLKQAFAACGFARLTSCHTSSCCLQCLTDNVLGLVGVALEPVTEEITGNALNESLRFGVTELGLGLTFELGFTQLDGDNCGKTFTDVITGEVFVLLLEDAFFTCVLVDQSGHCGTETLFVGSTLVRVDGVGVGVDTLAVCSSPLHRDFT